MSRRRGARSGLDAGAAVWWRQQAALTRLARRLARTGGWRHLLIVAMIAVSVAAATGVAILARSSDLPLEVEVAARFGTAEMVVERFDHAVGFQDLSPQQQDYVRRVGGPVRRVREPGVASTVRALAPGGEVLRLETAHIRAPGLSPGGSRPAPLASLSYVSVDLSDPLAAGLFAVDGPAPGPGEALVAPGVRDRLGTAVGQVVELPGLEGRFRVVGTVTDPRHLERPLVILPPGLELPGGQLRTTWLVGLPGRADPSTVQSLRRALEPSRVREVEPPGGPPQPPPAEEVREVSLSVQSRGEYVGHALETRAVTQEPSFLGAVVGAVLLLQVAFVSAAAFATGARRRLRDLGLLGATGATPQQVRGVVLREAIVLGTLGALVGVGLALAFAYTAGRPVAEALAGNLVPTVRLHALDLLAPAGLGLLAATAAGYLPARTAGRVAVTTALAGRLPVGRVPRWVTRAALAAVAAGVLALSSTAGSPQVAPDRTLWLGIGVAATVLGAAALAVPLLGLIGRGADRLPARLRLALRDTVRQRTRSGAAVAALTVVLVAPVTVITGMATESAAWGPAEDPRRDLVAVTGPAYAHLRLPPDRDALRRVEEFLPAVERRTRVARLRAGPSRTDTGLYLVSNRPLVPGQPRAPGQPRLERGDQATFRSNFSTAGLATPNLLDMLGLSHLRQEVADGAVVVLDRSGAGTVLYRDGAAATRPRAGGETDAGAGRGEARLVVGGPRAEDGPPTGLSMTVPVVTAAVPAEPHDIPALLVPGAVADRLGLQPAGQTVLLDLGRPVDAELAQRLGELGRSSSPPFHVSGPPGFGPADPTRPMALVAGGALLVALVIAGVTAALAATESDHDLELITAVGAAPAVRRAFHGWQAGYHTLLAAVLATPAGLLIFRAGRQPESGMVVPWEWLALIVLATPVVVGLVHAAAMRSAPVRAPRRIP